tara:strand:+ start:563 stop:1087 length:525 start_codon:yes stop_codon:yes gene_type:complete
MRAILAPFKLKIIAAGDMHLQEPVEDGDSFAANAEIKATAASQSTGLTAIADDSGLVVPSLNGSPGIYSARWAGPEKNYVKAIDLIKTRIGSLSRNAHFTCALTVASPSGRCHTFIGHVFGQLTFPPRGTKGFGYDSIFLPEGYSKTFGEMDQNTKHSISHRSQAFKQLQDELL